MKESRSKRFSRVLEKLDKSTYKEPESISELMDISISPVVSFIHPTKESDSLHVFIFENKLDFVNDFLHYQSSLNENSVNQMVESILTKLKIDGDNEFTLEMV